jgi:uncharacterized RDD family membrane protein YckC
MEATNFESTVDGSLYFNRPSLVLRIKSMLIDMMFLIGLAYIFTLLLESMNIISEESRGIALAIIILYEPVLVVIGGTVGQRIMGLRVRAKKSFVEKREKRNINFFNSLLRYISKILLGWIPLLTIHSDKYGQALHDKIGSSVMTLEK